MKLLSIASLIEFLHRISLAADQIPEIDPVVQTLLSATTRELTKIPYEDQKRLSIEIHEPLWKESSDAP